MPKVTYVDHPNWLKKNQIKFIKRFLIYIYEPSQLIYYTLRYKPILVNGVFTLPKGLYSVVAAKIGKTKSMISVIGGIPEIITYSRFKSLAKKINLWLYNQSDIVTTKGKMVKNYLINNGISENKLVVFNGSIDIAEFDAICDSSRNIDILFLGQFSELKGPHRVVKIIDILKKQYGLKNISAVFLGEGEKFKEIKNYVSENQLESNIKLLGYKTNVPEYLKNSKLLLMPSISEGLSTAMLEAMVCGCVPIVSDVGNMTDAAHHGQNSFVVKDYNDINTFAELAFNLLDNSEKRIEFAMNGIKLVEKNYSIEAQTRILENIITTLT